MRVATCRRFADALLADEDRVAHAIAAERGELRCKAVAVVKGYIASTHVSGCAA